MSLTIKASFAQNLVPNPSFELYDSLPCGYMTPFLDLNVYVHNWYNPSQSSPDIQSSLVDSACDNFQPKGLNCIDGSQKARTGNNLGGFLTYVYNDDWREYLKVKLSIPMTIGTTYIFQMYVSLGDPSQYVTDSLGVLFSDSNIVYNQSNNIPYTPQIIFPEAVTDKENWGLLSDTITATDSWKYIIIGNFTSQDSNPDTATFPLLCNRKCYYYLDDVGLYENNGKYDTVVCPYDSLLLVNSTDTVHYWYNINNLHDTLSIDSTLNVMAGIPSTFVHFGNNDPVFYNIAFKNPINFDFGEDILACDSNPIILDPIVKADKYSWQDGSSDSIYFVDTSGLYHLSVETNGCSYSDSIYIDFSSVIDFNTGQDTTICIGDTILLSIPNPNGTWYLHNSYLPDTYKVYKSGEYPMRFEINNCSYLDTIKIETQEKYNIFLGSDTVLCYPDSMIIPPYDSLSLANYSLLPDYVWNDSVISKTFRVSNSGRYVASYSNKGCRSSDTINVEVETPPLVNLGSDYYNYCKGDTITLSSWSSSKSLFYLWQDGSINDFFRVTKEGAYHVTVSNEHCSTTDTIIVKSSDRAATVEFPNIFSPNGDQLNDTFKPIKLDSQLEELYFSIYNRWGRKIFEVNDGPIEWSGANAPNGVYYWSLVYEDLNCITKTQKSQFLLTR